MQLATFYDHVKDIAREERVSVVEALQRVKSLGIDSVEVMQNSAVGREDELGHELACAGLSISGIPAYFDFGRDTDVEKQASPVLEAARYLGAGKMLVIPGFFHEEDSPEVRTRHMENMADCINRLAEMADKDGVALVMEEYDSPLAPFADTAGVQYFMDRCPALSCCFDTGNFRCVAEDELAAYEQFKGRLGHVHLKDRAYGTDWGTQPTTAADGQTLYPCPVGSGQLQIRELLTRMNRDGYDGACAIEHFGVSNMWAALQESVAWLQGNFSF